MAGDEEAKNVTKVGKLSVKTSDLRKNQGAGNKVMILSLA
jgi:hypothetical protein